MMASKADPIVFRAISCLESDVCDAKRSTWLAVEYLEGLLTADSANGAVRICGWQAELAIFALYQARMMVDTIHDSYFAVLNGKQPALTGGSADDGA